MSPRTALVVTAHGTVASLDELPEFLKVIRRGRPAPDELLREVRRRYEAIGGRSPLTEITAEQARKTAALLGALPYVGMRLSNPPIRAAIERLVADGVERVLSLPAAPFSTAIYHEPVERLLAELDPARRIALVKVGPWGEHRQLLAAFARRAAEAGASEPATHVLFTAHSLPVVVVERGDRYPALIEACARGVAAELGLPPSRWSLAYQSQGASEGPWLGPDLVESFDRLRAQGARRVVLAPIGFLTDHVELLYDLDIEAAQWARARGLEFARAKAPNADDDLCEAMASVARAALEAAAG
jgi:ferrochelatase